MSTTKAHSRRALYALLVVAILTGTIGAIQFGGAPPAAAAATPPVVVPDDGHVTADALPTVQINGVVYDQTIVGNTVYAVGDFSSARPAGSPLGVNEVPRTNMLAYNLTTGELIPSFNPVFNGKLYVVEPSPDGSRLYVGGLFTNVSGQQKYSLVALNPTTGAVISSFTPILNYMVKAIVATNDTVYIGGAFAFAGPGLSLNRSRLAAVSAANGSVLSWAPSADDEVQAMVMSPKGDRIFVGGGFNNVNGQPARGLAALDPQTGATLNWPVTDVVRNSNPGSAILTLSTDGKAIYGSGWAWGQTQGNLEGSFSADPDTGAINWIEDCHGDSYSGAVVNGYYYKAGHTHFCGNIGSFPQTETWADNQRHATSYSTTASGTVRREQWNYFNFEGQPAPSQTSWAPDWTIGTYTGASQATWSVAGNSQYVLFGGEFPRVNNQPQQGLVRFAVRSIAPKKERPALVNAQFPIEAVSDAAGRVRVTAAANWDRDGQELSYRLTRDGVTVATQTKGSTYWNRPIVTFIDTGRTAGQSHTYQIWATDPDGNTSASATQTVTVSGSGAVSAYADRVLQDGARLYWRLGSAPGGTVEDVAGTRNGVVSSASFSAAGAITGDTNTAASFTSSSSSFITEPTRGVLQDTLTVEAWVRTGSNNGGRIAGFATTDAGTSSGNYDRVLYMANDGRILFGARTRVEGSGPGEARERRTVESAPGYNNNQWHHVVGTLGPDGLHLYVDGVRVGSRADTTGGATYYGHFRVGADTLSGWPSRPSSDNLSGQIDEAAVYHQVLAPTQIADHYRLSGRSPAVPAVPADAYGAAVQGLDPYLYYRLAEASGSTANDTGIRANPGDYTTGTTRGQSGVVAGNASVRFNGSASVASRTLVDSPTNYSLETWFNTTSTTGGKLIGFGNARTGNSTISDRHVYMRNNGQLVFQAGGATVATTAAFNDGQWHHVVATQGQNGMVLYVDGTQVGTDPQRIGRSYAGYWRIGGDTTPADSTSSGFTGRLDEVAVYDRELTTSEVTQHLTLGGGQVANVNPTASFTVGGSLLDLSVDGTGSTDTDGSIVSYAWDFGDGATATGATANHTYASAGTYTVTLTVTDNAGGVGVTTQQVQVTAPPPNVPPAASFTTSINDKALSVNGTGSTDTDGSIVSYAWDFGDGATATGATANHTYASAGTYTVTLTVTDDDGAIGTTTRSVTATEPAGPVIHASDTFGRTVSGGLGTADVGGVWTTSGSAAWYSVSNGNGRHLLNAPGRVTDSVLTGVSATNLTMGVDVAFDKAPTGGGIFSSVSVRRVGSNEYRLRVRALPTGTELILDRTAGGVGALVASTALPGLVYSPGDVWRVRLDATGTSPTTLTAKVWNANGAEPTQPQLNVTDATAALQGPGGVAVSNFLSGSATNAPVNVLYDNLLAVTGDPNTPPPNVAPTASFSTGGSFLDLSVNGSASSDPDGSIVSYAWTFGDGATATGTTATHTYQAAGTYPVTLTVTDDDGATNTASALVTVSTEPVPTMLASDTFGRTVTGGLGTADVGGAWTTSGSAPWYSVSNGNGRHLLNAPGRVTDSALTGVSATDAKLSVDLAFDKAPTGGGIFSSVALRRVGNTEYRLRVRALPTGTELILDRTVGGVGALVANTSIPGLVYAPGDVWRVEFSATGSSPTTLTAKVWSLSGAEPSQPQLTRTDSTAGLQGPGGIAFNNFLSGTATNAPVNVLYDNLLVSAPN
jgi:PKD repeat protein